MNKSDLIAKVAETTGIAKAQVEKTVNGVFDAVVDAVKGGEEVRLPIAIVTIGERKAREARDPRDPSKKIQVKAGKIVKIKAAKLLKDAVA